MSYSSSTQKGTIYVNGAVASMGSQDNSPSPSSLGSASTLYIAR